MVQFSFDIEVKPLNHITVIVEIKFRYTTTSLPYYDVLYHMNALFLENIFILSAKLNFS